LHAQYVAAAASKCLHALRCRCPALTAAAASSHSCASMHRQLAGWVPGCHLPAAPKKSLIVVQPSRGWAHARQRIPLCVPPPCILQLCEHVGAPYRRAFVPDPLALLAGLPCQQDVWTRRSDPRCFLAALGPHGSVSSSLLRLQPSSDCKCLILLPSCGPAASRVALGGVRCEGKRGFRKQGVDNN
jgi:hypothetical protein